MSGNELVIPARGHSHGSAKPKSGSGSRNGPVGYLKVNRVVWEAALLIAEGKVNRIDVISPTKVEVWLTGGTREQ